MGEGLDIRRKGFRTLRKMLSMEALTKNKEEESNNDEVECLSVRGFESRRMSLNPELTRKEVSKTQEIRPILLRNKSFTGLTAENNTEEGTGTTVKSTNSRANAPRLTVHLPPRPPPAEVVVHHEVPEEREQSRRRVVERSPKTPPPSPMPLTSPSAFKGRGLPPFSPEGQTPETGLEELLECPVCLERLIDPKTLPCDHTFCLQCLKVQMKSTIGISDRQTGFIRCPVCRKEVNIPPDGLTSLPSNVYLQSLLRLVATRRTSRRSTPTSPESTSQMMLPPSNGCSKCGAIGQLHLYICGHCHQILCNQCLPPHFAELRENMAHMRDQLQTVFQRLQEAEKGSKDRFVQLRSQLKDETEKKLAQVREESTRLLERVNALESKRIEEGRSLLGRLGVTANAKNIDSFDTSSTEGKVEIFMKMNGEATELLNEATRWNEVLRSCPTFDRSTFRILDPQDEEDEEEAEEKAEEEEEEVEEAEEDKAVNGGEKRERNRELRRMDSRSQRKTRVLPTTHDELSLYYRSRSMSSPRWKFGGSREGRGGGEMYRPAGMGIAPWGGGTELYVTLSDGGKVSVFTKRSSGSGWKHSRVLPSPPSKERIMCPVGIAFSDKRAEMFITDKWCHCIHVYDSEGNWLRRLSKQGRSPGFLSSPEGIAASRAYIFVADTGNDRVQVLDASNGGFVTFIGSDLSSFRMEVDMVGPSAGSGYLMQPTGVALSADETKLIVCDSGHNRIKIFDVSDLCEGKGSAQSKPCCVFGSLGSQKGQFRSARGVAVDKMGFVTVADSGNSRVQIFRPDGRLVRAFGSKGKEPGQFGYPTSVHVGPSFELFVSDSSNHCMYIF